MIQVYFILITRVSEYGISNTDSLSTLKNIGDCRSCQY